MYVLRDYTQAMSSQVGKYQDDGLLGCGFMYFCRQVPTFWKNLMPGLYTPQASMWKQQACSE